MGYSGRSGLRNPNIPPPTTLVFIKYFLDSSISLFIKYFLDRSISLFIKYFLDRSISLFIKYFSGYLLNDC